MSAYNRELVQQLLEDTNLIEMSLSSNVPSPATIRALFGPILRKWVSGNDFHKVVNLLPSPSEVKFESIYNTECIAACKTGLFKVWMETVAVNGKMFAITKSFRSEDDIKQREYFYYIINNHRVPMSPKEFFQQPVFFWNSKFHYRDDMIRFFSNAQGGTHFSPKQSQDNIDILEIMDFFAASVSDEETKFYYEFNVRSLKSQVETRRYVYDYLHILTLDTAKTFAMSIRKNRPKFFRLLE